MARGYGGRVPLTQSGGAWTLPFFNSRKSKRKTIKNSYLIIKNRTTIFTFDNIVIGIHRFLQDWIYPYT